jgi:predicted urease superfamily metal-dependent hydrolase
MQIPQHIKLKENSWVAKIAARKMKAGSVALVLGKTIHLFNITPEEFKSSPRLIKHELKHVEQYKRMGFFTFLIVYGWYSLKYGYYKNPLEMEAREAEKV